MFVHVRPAQEGDPFVPEIDEVLDREDDAAFVLSLEPRERRVGHRPADDHDRHRRCLEQREPRIVELRIGQQEPVDAAGGWAAFTCTRICPSHPRTRRLARSKLLVDHRETLGRQRTEAQDRLRWLLHAIDPRNEHSGRRPGSQDLA
jgi:hypothetical protein